MNDRDPTIDHVHAWNVTDVYWASPPLYLGNRFCECGARQKGVELSEDEVRVYLARQEEDSDDQS